MIMIGNLQYAWTLFAEPMVKAHAAQGWQLSEVQWGFALFLAAGTWAMPFFASYIDKLGPRLFMVGSGVLCAVGWGALGQASNLISFYALFCLAGIGVACVYACGVSTAVKWFPDKRGLAAGITAAGFGAGSASGSVAEFVASPGVGVTGAGEVVGTEEIDSTLRGVDTDVLLL